MNRIIVKENIKIEDMIVEVRGKQVIIVKELCKKCFAINKKDNINMIEELSKHYKTNHILILNIKI